MTFEHTESKILEKGHVNLPKGPPGGHQEVDYSGEAKEVYRDGVLDALFSLTPLTPLGIQRKARLN